MKKLFVGKLAYATTDANLKSFFETIGSVDSAKVIMDSATGQSRGFGFVEFSDEADAKRAIEELNGKQLDGREITVNEANDDSKGRRSGGNGGGRSDSDRRPGRSTNGYSGGRY